MLKQIRKSLITRLMLYFFFTGFIFLIIIGIDFSHNMKVHFQQEILPNIAQYLEYIADDIGSPPDVERAQALSKKLSFDLMISGPSLNWKTSDKLPAFENIKFKQAPEPYEKFRIARKKSINYVSFRSGDYVYTYIIGKFIKRPNQHRHLVLMVGIILGMLLLFLLIRSTLKPLKSIDKGVKKIAEGDLDSKIEIQSSLEFNQLATGINNMSQQIKSMLESKRQLLLAISHELLSPLTRAKVNLELLADNNTSQALKDDVKEMQDLINQLLETERLNHHAVLSKSSFRLDKIIESTIQQFFPDAKIISSVTAQTVDADQTRIALLIKNLLDNAIKYTAKDSEAPSISLTKNSAAYIIEIIDHGCGIEQDKLDHITDAFYRIDDSRQRNTGGFGLGLYLCKMIVNAHNGTMTISSQPGQGTVVTIELPD